MEADILQSKENRYLVQKYGGQYFAKVKRIDILSRSMEADILQKVKRIDILARSMEADICKSIVHQFILFRSAHRHNYLLHYHGCIACHQNS